MLSFLDRRAIRRAVAAAPIERQPFPHFFVSGLLPDGFYKRLMAAWPAERAMHRLSDFQTVANLRGSRGFGARYFLGGEARGPIAISPEIESPKGRLEAEAPWIAFEDAFRDVLLPAIWRKLSADVYRAVALSTGRHTRIRPAYRSGDLSVSTGHFSLPPHADNRWYLITCLMFMPEREERPELGTQLFAFSDPAALNPQYAELREVKRAPYKPNSMLCFVNTPWSFHGSPGGAGDYKRRLYINYLNPPAEDARRIYQPMR